MHSPGAFPLPFLSPIKQAAGGAGGPAIQPIEASAAGGAPAGEAGARPATAAAAGAPAAESGPASASAGRKLLMTA